MSLKVWYPLVDNLENKGLDDTPLTVHGSVPFENARVRTAPRFNGVQGNNFIRPVFLTKDNNFSVSLWIKRADTAGSYILYQGNTGIANEFAVTNDTNVSLRYVNNVFNFGNFAVNTWHHITVTIDENKIVRGYTDGVLVFTSPSAITFTPNDRNFAIGGVGTNYFNGQIQDFRYYDHCLSPKEVKELSQGLCLHLKCDGIGAGENLLKNSAVMFGSVGRSPNPAAETDKVVTRTLETDETAPCGTDGKVLHVQVRKKDGADFTVFPTGSYWFGNSTFQAPLTVGDIYCVSCFQKATNFNGIIRAIGFESHTTIQEHRIKLTDEWQKVYRIFRVQAPSSDPEATTVASVTTFYWNIPANNECDLYVCSPKVERLTMSPYLPNPVDSQYSQYLPTQEDDCSGLGFNANYKNMTASDVTINNGNARYNTSLTFDKTKKQYLLGEKSPFTTETKNFTISAWVKVNEWSDNNIFFIFINRDSMGAGYGISVFEGNNNTLTVDCFGLRTFLACPMSLGTWYHLAVSVTQTSISVYLNGVLIQTKTLTNAGEHTHLTDFYTVNAYTQTGAIASGGQISDFRIYTTALSATDIKALYETSASIDRDNNFYTYEYDEGLQASITKTGIANFTDLKEVNNTMSIEQNLTKVNNLIEN